MNKFSAYAALTCLAFSTLVLPRPQEVYSRSFLFTRSIHNSLALRNAFWHDFIYDKEGSIRGSWQAIGFHQQSQSLGKTQRYFLQKHKDCVTIAGDAVTDQFFTRDMRAEWVGLPSSFSGVLTIDPLQSQTGGYIEYNQDLGILSDSSFFKNLWCAFSLPVIFVENDFNPAQSNVENPDALTTPAPHDILQAFSQDAWIYDKFPTKKQHAAGAAEFRVDLGSTYKGRNLELAYYSFFTAALAPKQDSAWLFSPYVGNDHHWSIGYGIHMDYLMSQETSQVNWSFFIDCEMSYLIHNKQHRTLDLFGKPWSRFLQFRRRNSPPGELIPGVNVMTIPVIVRPYGIFDFSIGWRVQMSMVVCEVTYSVWGHDEQKVKLRDTFADSFCNQEYGIAGAGTIEVEGKTVGASASKSTISNQAADDPTFIAITPYDLNFQSAAGSSATNHKAQIAMGIERKHVAVETFLGVAVFADIAQKNGALQAIGGWAKCGMSF